MSSLWDRFQKFYLRRDALGFPIDISRIRFDDDFFAKMEPKAWKVYHAPLHLSANLSGLKPVYATGPATDTFALS